MFNMYRYSTVYSLKILSKFYILKDIMLAFQVQPSLGPAENPPQWHHEIENYNFPVYQYIFIHARKSTKKLIFH